MSHVFISYSKKNKTYALDLKSQLINLGFDVWIDEVIEPGDGWFRSIRAAIKDCAAFVLIMTPESENSHWVNLELLHALEYRKPIFPLLRAGGSNPLESDVWAQIANIQFTDVRDGSMPPDRFYERLINRGVPRKLRGQDKTPPVVEAPPIAPSPPAPLPQGEGRQRVQPPIVLPDLSSILPPPFDWCRIPAGPVTLTEGGYVPKGGQTFDVPAFAIAKYPVTNAQFDVFVKAKEGYRDSKWWDYSDDAMAWRKNNTKPQDPAFGGVGDHPRANVTWYEAVAFCRWLTAHVDPTPIPSPNSGRGERGGILITLPTEQQWQRAAQALPDGSDSGYAYPWGPAWDAARCNNSVGKDWQKNHTSRVTQYQGKGDSPCGVVDMSGNVWEWCLTDYETGEQDENKSSKYRVLRGGSWLNDHTDNFRADYRDWFYPDYGNLGRGFRLALSY